MSMRFANIGEKLKGFVMAPNQGIYGVIEEPVDPAMLRSYVGYEYVSRTTRYLYVTPLTVFYADKVPAGSPDTLTGLEKDDCIRGDVVIYGQDGGIRGLTDFEIALIKGNISLEKDDACGSYAELSGLSMRPRQMPRDDDV